MHNTEDPIKPEVCQQSKPSRVPAKIPYTCNTKFDERSRALSRSSAHTSGTSESISFSNFFDELVSSRIQTGSRPDIIPTLINISFMLIFVIR